MFRRVLKKDYWDHFSRHLSARWYVLCQLLLFSWGHWKMSDKMNSTITGVTFGTKRCVWSLYLKNRPQKGPFTSFNYEEIWPFWEHIGQVSLKIVASVKVQSIVLRPPGRDITPQARIVWRMATCIGLSKEFCYLFLATTIYAISCSHAPLHTLVNVLYSGKR